jgi:hypothetical protein
MKKPTTIDRINALSHEIAFYHSQGQDWRAARAHIRAAWLHVRMAVWRAR